MDEREIPKMPDFQALEAASADAAAERRDLFEMIGCVVVTWSNNESLLIYVIAILLRIDLPSAAMVFGTLNTTRARLDLVRRLGRTTIPQGPEAAELVRIVRWFDACTRIRNELNHSMYVTDEHGTITHSQALRVEDGGSKLSFGRQKAFDDARTARLRESIESMTALNRAIWKFLPELDRVTRGRTGREARSMDRGEPPADAGEPDDVDACLQA